MQKTTVFLIALCVMYTSSLLAQTSCASFQVIPDFDTSDTVYVDLHEKLFFQISVNLPIVYSDLVAPPGYFMNNYSSYQPFLYGEVENPGTYQFSFVATNTQTGCRDTVSFSRTYVNSPTHICEPITIRSDWNSGSEHWVGALINMNFNVTDGGEDPPFTFTSPDLRPTATLTSSGHYTDTTRAVENYTVTIVVHDEFGCTDSLSYPIFTMCVVPEPMSGQTITTGTAGQPYNQVIPGAQLGAYGPFSNFRTFDPLPPGLTLASNGTLSGTPTASGNYSFQTRYNGVGGCPAVSYVSMRINQSAPVQSLWITPVCAPSELLRNWVLHNPNPFAINVDWVRRYYPLTTGNIVAQPGDNILSIRKEDWPNTVVIKWYDQNGVQKSIVQASNDDLCTPPECAQIDGVTFYHQGRQRNGNPVEPGSSYSRAVEGAPDADANPSLRYFSLGYNGFITMKLTANVYDQPGPDLKVWEYSVNDPDFATYPEQAEVFVSTDNATWISLGKTNPTGDCHSKLDWSFDLAGKATWCRYVKVVDVTERWAMLLNGACAPTGFGYCFNDSSDGFDLDAVTCANYNGNQNGARVASDVSAEKNLTKEDSDDQFAVAYPNPATSWLTLDFARDPDFIYPESGQVEINVVDMTGKIGVGGMHYLDNEWKAKVNVETLSPGLFIAKVRANGEMRHYKFVRN